MASAISLNNLQSSLATYQRRVQESQSQVQEDNARLARSQAELSRDQDQLSRTQQQTRQAEQPAVAAAAPVRLDSAITTPVAAQTPLPAALATSAPYGNPQVNTQGQTIGSLINVTA